MVGTLVWDTIRSRDVRTGPVEEWGGIGYALEALSAGAPPGWEVVPLLKVGGDLEEQAVRYLQELPRVEIGPGVVVVPEPNNRVELQYEGGVRRSERLQGGVPPWSWPELAPLVRDCDALYVNFISGFEMELETALALRDAFPGPTYADLHSLFLGVNQHGFRVPRPLPLWREWLRAFDAVQMNEAEFELLGQAWGDPWLLAADVVGPELKLMVVTLGAQGAGYVLAPGCRETPSSWPGLRHQIGVAGQALSGRVKGAAPPVEGDPTGCGDVWGATFFVHLLQETALEEAMETANLWAARNVSHRGARGLRHHLKGRLAPEGRGP